MHAHANILEFESRRDRETAVVASSVSKCDLRAPDATKSDSSRQSERITKHAHGCRSSEVEAEADRASRTTAIKICLSQHKLRKSVKVLVTVFGTAKVSVGDYSTSVSCSKRPVRREDVRLRDRKISVLGVVHFIFERRAPHSYSRSNDLRSLTSRSKLLELEPGV